MFSKEKQELKSIDILSSFGGLFVVFLTAWAIVHGEIHQAQVLQTQVQARQIMERVSPASGEPQLPERSPASSSKSIEQVDSWGRPFLQKVVRNRYGQPILKVVWSRGSNGIDDSSGGSIPNVLDSSNRIEFGGDDIGQIQAVE